MERRVIEIRTRKVTFVMLQEHYDFLKETSKNLGLPMSQFIYAVVDMLYDNIVSYVRGYVRGKGTNKTDAFLGNGEKRKVVLTLPYHVVHLLDICSSSAKVTRDYLFYLILTDFRPEIEEFIEERKNRIQDVEREVKIREEEKKSLKALKEFGLTERNV
jgi:hypothetical protein